MDISFLGGASEVGASSILVNINGKNILMDCGIRQGASKDVLPDFRTIQEKGGVDAIIISHAHMDHIGAVPVIAKEYPLAKIYCNNMTKDLMRVLFNDSLKIMNNREVEIPLYSEGDVESVLNKTYTYNFEVPFSLFDDITVTFYMAGHIPGASCVYVTSPKESIFYSGDFSLFPQINVEGSKIPKLRPDVAILESTYGDKLHANRKLEEERLVDILNNKIGKGGKVLIPAFALGRAQEVILILKKAINNKKMPKVKVYVDGMVRSINTAFKRNPLYLRQSLCKKILKGIEPFYDENIIAIEKKEQRDEILKAEETCIIISSSGMVTGGPSQYYAEKLLSDENSTIIISGYQDEESPGRKILNLFEVEKKDRKLEINNRIIPVKCDIEKVQLSAHGDKSEIKGLYERLTPKHLFLVHGNREVIENLGKEMSTSTIGGIYTPMVGDSYDINVKNPRKQFNRILNYLMNKQEEINEDNLKELRMFVRDKYFNRLFTAEELLTIWNKNIKRSEEEIQHFQNILIESPYFESDIRRLFMFEPTSEDDLEKLLKKQELNQTDVNNILSEKLSKYNFKKIGLKVDEKTAIIYFDFPLVVSKEIYNVIDEIKEEIKWNVEVSNQTNFNALDTAIREAFDYNGIKKISHNQFDNNVTLKIENQEDFNLDVIRKEILEKTGYNILFKDSDASKQVAVAKEEVIDQNRLIGLIDNAFSNAKYKPYKKSIITIGYMKLSFISPKAGLTYQNKIEEISRDSGWKLEVNNSYNQNEIMNLAESLCRSFDIELKKRPSFNPQNGSVKIQIVNEVSEDKFNEFKEKFFEMTASDILKG